MAVATPPETYRDFHPRGAAHTAFHSHAPEAVLSGPAGTGKTRTWLEKLHLCLMKYDGARALMLRKTHAALTSSALVTYREKIQPALNGVRFYGGSAEEPPQYRYPNGSRLLLGGMDKATKVLSTEFDLIYVNETTELTEAEWETLTTRLRYGKMPYQQLMADCNPDAPSHWLKLRADRGATALWESRHADNPSVTPAYLATLDALTGVLRDPARLAAVLGPRLRVYQPVRLAGVGAGPGWPALPLPRDLPHPTAGRRSRPGCAGGDSGRAPARGGDLRP
jgi:phage terminase large subunit